MKIKSVDINLIETPEGFGYDVEITDEGATLAQYIEALDNFLDAKVAPCLGCDNCCYQRIPLILPDIYQYAGKEPKAIGEFLEKRCAVTRLGAALDIRLAQGEDGICTFLDGDNQRCTDHLHRTMVCHTYICLPQTPRARELREHLINQGEDALVAELLTMGLLPRFKEMAGVYPTDPHWAGKDYHEVLLQQVVPEKLWAELTNSL